MKELQNHSYLKNLQRRWISIVLISNLMIALALSTVLISILNIFLPLSLLWILPFTLLASLTIVLWSGILNTSQKEVARLLNQSYPQLEESTELLIKQPASLNILEKLQVQKIEQQLTITPIPREIFGRLKFSMMVLLIALLLSFGLTQITLFGKGDSVFKNKTKTQANTIPDKILPEIKSISLTINPPTYTKHEPRQQSQFSVSAEDGSVLEWNIKTDKPVQSFKLIFNDKERISLRAINEKGTQWMLRKTIIKSGFYQAELNGKLSDLYKLETIKDQPAVIRIISPSQYSSIDFGEPQRTSLQVLINDDYGVTDAFISATISSGQGEGVNFKEQRLSFKDSFSGAAQYNLSKRIELQELGMVPGDELYFYIQALDSRKQISRSDIYIVTIQDTAQLMSLDGMLSGVNLVPEYFRSQRQIIIDTEKLLNQKATISTEEFNNRSNDLGFDQKILRLRYGKFLGEESDTEIGEGHEDKEDDYDPSDFGNAEKLMDAYAHKHDIAEDATFFEPELKAQLKATLSEMWKSELRLRTYKPSEALPFEYKALRLLKDLQQKSRAYVAKTAFKPPAIKPDKRLSGDLDKIIQPQAVRTLNNTADLQNSLRSSAALIAGLNLNRSLNSSEIWNLQDAGRFIAERASAQPSVYLKPLGAIRAIIRSGGTYTISAADRDALQSALQKIIKQESRVPQSKTQGPGSALSDEYFKNLRGKMP
jgi:hypothetical protein